jgi:lysozyme
MSGKTKIMLGGGLATGAALAISVPFIAGWEGKSNDPYKDIVGVSTVCYGETRVAMKKYTDKECEEMLSKGVEEFMKPILVSTPTLQERPYELAAATSLSYNIGQRAYEKSTVRRLFLQGRFKEGCRAFLAWNKARRMGRLVEVKGLTNRRKAEVNLCLKGSSYNTNSI